MNQPHFPFSFRGEFADGQSAEFVPTAVRPFGVSELRTLSQQSDAVLVLQCLADNIRVNGDTVAGMANAKARLSFSEDMAIYALVPNGGWLPLPFVSPQQFLLDRNVVANFRKLRENKRFTDRTAYAFWTQFFEQSTPLFSPLPYAFEGEARRIPSLQDFVEMWDRGVKEIEETFPRSCVVRYSPEQYRIAHAQLEAMHENTPREIEFLCEISPLLAVPTAHAKVRAITGRILEAADRLNVDRQSLAVVTALSCLCENPRSGTPSIGRGILKPAPTYSAGDAYNAICDLRHIELAASGHAWVTAGKFALCTSDKAVALLWCALGIRDVVATAEGAEYAFDFSQELFPRLTEVAIGEMAGMLAA